MTPRAEADIHLLRLAEHLLASAIGAASSRLVLSLLLRRRNVSSAAALRLVDDASAALLYNRDMLQHALDFARQGISVFDADLRLTCWNREFRDMFELPGSFTRTGVALDDILRFNAERGLYGHGASDELVAGRLERLTNSRAVPRAAGDVGPGHRNPLRPHARRRPRHDLYRRHRAVRRRTGARIRQ